MSLTAGTARARSYYLSGMLICCLIAPPVLSQTAQEVRNVQKDFDVPRTTCPGDPPANLGSFDCSFTMSLRLQQFVAGSLTDQAMLGATFFGTIAQLQHDPREWKQNWGGFGYRVGSRYGQNLAKGLTEFTVGAVMRADPRHVSYSSDPGIRHKDCANGLQDCQLRISSRIGHVFLDWLTVRQSSVDGNGKRLPNLPLFSGAAVSGFVGNAWYPDSRATPGQAGIRATSSLATALAASLYTEFSPEAGRLLGAIFKQGRTPKAPPKAVPGAHK